MTTRTRVCDVITAQLETSELTSQMLKLHLTHRLATDRNQSEAVFMLEKCSNLSRLFSLKKASKKQKTQSDLLENSLKPYIRICNTH